MTFLMCGVLLLVGGGQWVWKRLRDRRELAAERDEMEQLLRDTFQALLNDTPPVDVVDGPWNRSDREVHGMTAPDLVETRAQFSELIGREWPNQQT